MFIHFPNHWTPEMIKHVREILASIAKSYGHVTQSGPGAGSGNIRELLIDLAMGRLVAHSHNLEDVGDYSKLYDNSILGEVEIEEVSDYTHLVPDDPELKELFVRGRRAMEMTPLPTEKLFSKAVDFILDPETDDQKPDTEILTQTIDRIRQMAEGYTQFANAYEIALRRKLIKGE